MWAFLRRYGYDRSLPYLGVASAMFFGQHALVLAIAGLTGHAVQPNAEFWLLPFRTLSHLRGLPSLWLGIGLIATLAAAAGLGLLSFGRATRLRWGSSFAAMSMVPLLQIPAVVGLALMPVDHWRPPDMPAHSPTTSGWAMATRGMLAGMALVVFAVAVGALVFGVYGWGLFVVSPFMVGLTTGYLANRGATISSGRTIALVLGASGLGALALMAFALEGAICIAMASPLAGLVALGGGALGRRLALGPGPDARPTLVSVSLLPLVFASELALPPVTTIDTRQSVEVAASPSQVWRALVQMDAIPAPRFPLGLAYPVRAEIRGSGVGAERLGYFSSGVARERVTAWAPNSRLAFTVLSDPPAMRELSPYAHVNAPHVQGYFHTTATSFELTPLPGGRTRLVERTSHELRLDPVLYWLPMARVVIDRNNARVLAHVRRSAERPTVSSRPPSP